LINSLSLNQFLIRLVKR